MKSRKARKARKARNSTESIDRKAAIMKTQKVCKDT